MTGGDDDLEGVGGLEDAHAHENCARVLIGKLPALDELTPEWVVSRLMIEATDRGKRTRQTSRVAALGMLAKMQGLLEEDGLNKDKKSPLQRAIDMTPEDRAKLLREKLAAMNWQVISNDG